MTRYRQRFRKQLSDQFYIFLKGIVQPLHGHMEGDIIFRETIKITDQQDHFFIIHKIMEIIKRPKNGTVASNPL